MDALLDALEDAAARADPARRRRRWLIAGAAALTLAGTAAGLRGYAEHTRTVCLGGLERVATAWGPDAREAVRAQFARSGKVYAAEAFKGVGRALDAYAGAWAQMHREACEATRLRGDQSEHLMDLRVACLERRRQELSALVEVLRAADATAVERAVQAAGGLTPVTTCADTDALSAEVPPPEDAAGRQRVRALQGELSTVSALRAAGKYVDALAAVKKLAGSLAPEDHAPTRAEALFLLGDLQGKTGDAKSAEATLLDALLAADVGRHDRARAQAATERVFFLQRQGRLDDALAQARVADAAIARLGRPDDLQARLENYFGLVYTAKNDFAQARVHHQRALELRERAFGPDALDVGVSLNNLGNLLRDMGQFDEAAKLHGRALALFERALGPDHPTVAVVTIGVANHAANTGRLLEALPRYQRAAAILASAKGPQHPDVGACENNIAWVLMRLGRFDEAAAHELTSLKIAEAAGGPECADAARGHNGLGLISLAQGKLPEAEQSFRRALELREKLFGPQHSAVAESARGVSEVLERRGRFAEAEELLRRVQAIQEKTLGREHVELASTLHAAARAASRRGDQPKAIALHREALALRQKALGKENQECARSWTELAAALRQAGDARGEVEALEHALAIDEKLLGDAHPETVQVLLSLSAEAPAPRAVALLERAAKAELAAGRDASPAQLRLAQALWSAGRQSDAVAAAELAAAGKEAGDEARHWLATRGAAR